MLKMCNMGLIRYPSSISKEILAVFQKKKNLKLTPKMKKIPIFQSFHAFFVKCLTDFVNLKNLKGQQGKGWLSSSLFRRVKCIFQNENVSK